ncbi:MAG: mechanosensitive ion channel family protein [Microscillaceae bacterium]|nr:mechanosensitive ion channel family protein [Microscillaceae bacterium]
MHALFTKTFYGSTISQWLTAMFIILASLIVGRMLYWFFTRIVRLFTRKTKTKLDDIIIDKIEEPIVAGLVILGIWYGLSVLSLEPATYQQMQGIVYLLVILNIAWLVVRTVDGLIEEYIVPAVAKSENNLDDAILPIARRGFGIIVWFVAVVVGLNNAGYDVATILAGLGIGGIAFAIGARATIMNMFGGLNVLVTQPFKIEDRIQIDDYDGYVEKIGLSTTRIRTFLDNYLVTIPNKVFTDKEIVNVSAAPGSKSEMMIPLPVDTPTHHVQAFLEFLKDLALTNFYVDRECKVTLKGFNDYALVVQFIYYIKVDAPFWDIQSEVNLAVMSFLRDRGLRVAVRFGFNPPLEPSIFPLGQSRTRKKVLSDLSDEEDDFS